MCHKCSGETEFQYEHTSEGNIGIISIVVGVAMLLFVCLVPFVIYS